MGKRNQSDQAENMGFSQIEDRVMKTAAQFFGEDLLPYVGVEGRIAGIAPTEHIHLEMRRLEEDFNFIMTDGSWRHLEFESDSITQKDLRRFREYEAYIGFAYDVQVTTVVLCTSKVKVLMRELMNGDSVYRIKLVRLRDRSGDKVFEKLGRKIRKGKALKRRDVFPLLLAPFMSGTMGTAERIYQGMEFLQRKELDIDDDERKKMQSVLYALAVKFLNREELGQIKERIGMTVLGEMLLEQGIEQGIEKGIEKGMREGKREGAVQALERVNTLNARLAEAGRTDDIIRAATDRQYQDRLFHEFGL